MHIVINELKEGRSTLRLERKVPLIAIKSISMTNLRDDWLALNLGLSEEGDPILSCDFKTELAAELLTLTRASIQLLIGPTYASFFFINDNFSLMLLWFYRIEYSKKKDKKAVIKAVKDETVQKDDVYKSHAIHVPSGEPPNSVSMSPAKRKPGVVRPITKGKLLRKGGPSDSVSQRYSSTIHLTGEFLET